jgi:hypothetical protein
VGGKERRYAEGYSRTWAQLRRMPSKIRISPWTPTYFPLSPPLALTHSLSLTRWPSVGPSLRPCEVRGWSVARESKKSTHTREVHAHGARSGSRMQDAKVGVRMGREGGKTREREGEREARERVDRWATAATRKLSPVTPDLGAPADARCPMPDV